jgi:HAE1 family hydrophobic/amphiphilic exporter-1
MKLVDLPIDRPVTVLMILISLTVLGAVAVFELPLDFMPDVKEPEVGVSVPFPGSHPLETLKEVGMPIEAEIATIPDVKRIRTFAESESAWVAVDFDWSVNVDLKKMEVREAVERVRPLLPAGIGHIRVEGEREDAGGTILMGRISADRDLSESWDVLDRRIRRPLERIKGVARVNLYGVEPQQVRIDLDLAALRRHHIEPRDLVSGINAANADLDLGAIHGDVLRFNVRSASRFRDLDTIRNLPAGPPGVRIRDVAEVSLQEPRLNYGRHLDRHFAVGIDVYRQPAANTVETVDRLMERIDEIRRDPELRGIRLLVWNNAGEEIRSSLKGLRDAGLFGGLLAVAVLYLFLRKVRTTLIVAVSIPFSLVVTCGFMYMAGMQFNVLTMTGLMLGVGMLVDNAVVVTENIHRLEGLGVKPREAARLGTSQVALAVLASTATTIIVWSWLFVTERSGLIIYMEDVAIPICISVACSLLISVTFIPLSAARLVPKREIRPGFFLQRFLPSYRRLLGWTLKHRAVTLGCLILLAGTSAIPITSIEKSGEPRFRQRAVPILYEVHDTGTKEVMEGYVNQVEAWLFARKDELGFENVYSWFGERGGVITQVYLPKEKATEEAVNKLREKMREGLPAVPGVTLSVGQREWWSREREGRRIVSVAINGEDPEYLEKLALDAEERLRGLPGAIEIYGPSVRGQKEVRVLVDPERAQSLGITPIDVGQVVAFAFRGQPLRRFQGPNGELEVILGLPEDARPGLASLDDLVVPRPGAEPIPLKSVASINLARTPPGIVRIDRKTTMWVAAEFDAKAVTTPEARKRIEERLKGFRLPEGYSWDWGWQGHERDENLNVMIYGVLIALAVVVLLMMALFESFTQPLAILITLPLAFFGAFWVLWLFGFELDSVAFMGVIVLIGIVVNNGIVMVDHVNALRRGGMERGAAMLQGCSDRMRPVLMTALTTLFGLLPLAFSGATVANAYIDSLAVGVIGGLITSTLFTLVALPVWYTAVEDLGAFMLQILPRRTGRAARLRFPGGA